MKGEKSKAMDTIIGIVIIALILGSQLFGGIVSGEVVTSESPINIHSDSVDSTPDYSTLSTSTVTCYFHAGGECDPSGYPNSCTPSCSGTLSGCSCEIDKGHYYCYEEGYCFSEAGCDSGGCDYIKLKVTYNSITYLFIVNGTECYYYAPDAYAYLLTITTRTTLHGYIEDLDNNPLEGLTVELHDCFDEFIASDTTDSTGYFSVTANAGHYKIFIVVSEAYRIKLVDSEGDDCFLLMGDVDIGTLNINPTSDCSVFNYMCYGPDKNIKLFNCYWDDGCRCYGQECRCGCTDGAPECDPCDVGTIYVDVDNINDNYNPLPGAKVYLEGEYKGTTESFGKNAVSAGYGYREVKVECPDGSYCDSQTVYVDRNEYLYFDCDCDTHRGDLQVNVDNINGYPVANVYVYVDSEERALTNPFGYAYIEDVPYGNHHIDIRYRITNLDYEGDYQKSRDITVDESKEVVNFIATLPGESRVAQSKGDCSNFSRIDDFTPEIAPVAVAMAVIDVASVAWSTEEFCMCVFQEEDSFGVPQCVNAIKSCVGDTRNCVAEIRENAGPAADRCKFEEAMLVGDAVSPFIPAGFVGHGLAMVVGNGRVLKFVDDIGETGRVIKTKAGGTVEYVKGGVSWAAKWFEGIGFKLGIIHYVPWWDELSQTALNGWNKALKNVDKQTGKELLESLGKGGADRAGKNLAEMADNAAEWMAKSEIGRKALKEWGDDAQKGLAKIFKKHGEGFVNTLVKRYKEEIVEITSKGVERNVIDTNKVNPEKLAVYVRGVRKTGVIDPLEEIGEDQLLKMMADTRGVVNVGGESVRDVSLLVKGTDDYGWTHIKRKHITSEISGGDLFPEKFGVSDEKKIQEWIQKSIREGNAVRKPGYINRWEYTYEPFGDGRKVKTIVEYNFRSNVHSRIISSYPLGL